jgi:hypothetical protein
MLLAALVGWLEREQRDVIAFLREENRVLKRNSVGVDCDWMTSSADVSPYSATGLGATYCVSSRRSSPRTRFFGGIGSWSPGNGRTHVGAQSDHACRQRFGGSSCGWRLTIRSGDTRGSKER